MGDRANDVAARVISHVPMVGRPGRKLAATGDSMILEHRSGLLETGIWRCHGKRVASAGIRICGLAQLFLLEITGAVGFDQLEEQSDYGIDSATALSVADAAGLVISPHGGHDGDDIEPVPYGGDRV